MIACKFRFVSRGLRRRRRSLDNAVVLVSNEMRIGGVGLQVVVFQEKTR